MSKKSFRLFKSPWIITVLALGFIGFEALWQAEAVQRRALQVGDGVVMGRDFTQLLANPFVEMSVEEGEQSVSLVFRSQSAGRLAEVRELGEYMRTIKASLEQREPWQGEPIHPNQRTGALLPMTARR